MLQWLHYFHCWVFQDEKKILIAISSATIQHFVFREGKKTRCWRIFHRDYYFRLHLLDTTIFFTLVTMRIFFLLWSCPLRCICTCPQHYFVISKREYCIKSTLKWTALSKQDWKAAPSYGNVSLFRRFWIATTLCQVALDGFADSQK